MLDRQNRDEGDDIPLARKGLSRSQSSGRGCHPLINSLIERENRSTREQRSCPIKNRDAGRKWIDVIELDRENGSKQIGSWEIPRNVSNQRERLKGEDLRRASNDRKRIVLFQT